MPSAPVRYALTALFLIAVGTFSAKLSQAQSASTATPTPTAPVITGSQLPHLGDGSDMTSSAERRLGDKIVRELYRDPDYLDDPVLVEYVQAIWQPLLAAARLRGDVPDELAERFAWEILLGRDRSINAFALPGGYFGLHLGLVGVVASRDELASVLAHELSHVTQRHISRLIAKQSAQTPWLIGAMILGALAASKNPDAANAVMVGGQALAAQNQLNFSRDMEREADRMGFGVMTQAGFESRAFVTMFDKLQQAARLNDNGAFPYLRSHPLTTERIADMQARQQAGASAPGLVAVTLEHAMVAARARVLSNPGVDALRAWAVDADAKNLAGTPAPRQAAALYGATLAGMRLRDFPQAGRFLTRLAELTRADAPAARQTRLLGAELALAAGDTRRATAFLDGSLDVKGDAHLPGVMGRPELFLWSQATLSIGQGGGAAGSGASGASGAGGAGDVAIVAQRLQTWVATHPRDATAWQLLSAAYAAQGQTLRAIRAEAEVQVAQLDYAAAGERFKAAQDLVRSRVAGTDHIEASIIDTRAREVQSILREQALER
jgi:predicted Zn-dependent protease